MQNNLFHTVQWVCGGASVPHLALHSHPHRPSMKTSTTVPPVFGTHSSLLDTCWGWVPECPCPILFTFSIYSPWASSLFYKGGSQASFTHPWLLTTNYRTSSRPGDPQTQLSSAYVGPPTYPKLNRFKTELSFPKTWSSSVSCYLWRTSLSMTKL